MLNTPLSSVRAECNSFCRKTIYESVNNRIYLMSFHNTFRVII